MPYPLATALSQSSSSLRTIRPLSWTPSSGAFSAIPSLSTSQKGDGSDPDGASQRGAGGDG